MDPVRSRRIVDDDTRFDRQGVHAGTIVLAVIGGLGLCQLLFLTGSIVLISPSQALITLLPPLVFLLAVFALFYFRSRPANGGGSGQEGASVGKAVVRTLATLGAIVCVLTTLLMATVIYFFVVCFSSLGGPNH